MTRLRLLCASSLCRPHFSSSFFPDILHIHARVLCVDPSPSVRSSVSPIRTPARGRGLRQRACFMSELCTWTWTCVLSASSSSFLLIGAACAYSGPGERIHEHASRRRAHRTHRFGSPTAALCRVFFCTWRERNDTQRFYLHVHRICVGLISGETRGRASLLIIP